MGGGVYITHEDNYSYVQANNVQVCGGGDLISVFILVQKMFHCLLWVDTILIVVVIV